MFLDEWTNYTSASASEHEKTDHYLKSIESQENFENQLAWVSRKCKTIQKLPENSTLKQGFNKISTPGR